METEKKFRSRFPTYVLVKCRRCGEVSGQMMVSPPSPLIWALCTRCSRDRDLSHPGPTSAEPKKGT